MINQFCSEMNNAYLAKHLYVRIKFNKKFILILNYFMKKGYINNYTVMYKKSKKNYLKKIPSFIIVDLKYINNQRLFFLKQESKNSKKVYWNSNKRIKNLENSKVILLFTSKGLCDIYEATSKNIGGEVILSISFLN